MQMSIFSSLFTIFALLAGGYFAKRTGVLRQRQARTFLDFAIIFALPCLIFDRIYHLDFDFSLIVLILMGLASCLSAAFIVLLLGYILKFSKVTLVSMFLLASFGNTIFVGIPIISGIFPNNEALISEIIFYDALATALPVSLFGPFILAFASEQKTNFIESIRKIITFPPFFALAFGFVCKLVYIPDFIFTPIRMFGSSATTIALFAIGVGLSFNAIKSSYKSSSLVILAKMVLAPLFFISVLKLMKIEFAPSVIVAIIESAMPTMTLAGAMVMKAKLDSNLAVSSVAFGIVFAFVSMPCLVWLLT